MAEHYTRGTESILQWCDTCRRLTVHPISAGRVGRCSEHQPTGESKRQQKTREHREAAARQRELFQ